MIDSDVEKIVIRDINDVYDIYITLLRDIRLCESNKELLSNFSFQIDAFALAHILNFFNAYPELSKENWQSNLLVIRMFSVFTIELCKFLQSKNFYDINGIETESGLKDIKSLRNKIHQYRERDYKKKIQGIDQGMGRSRDKLAPHLDICLQFSEKRVLMGTNIYWFLFTEAKEQCIVDFMQKIVRSVEKVSPYANVDLKLKRCVKKIDYKLEPYCYVDIIENCEIKNEKIIDRLLLSFDDLCSLYELFVYIIDVSDYLKPTPFIIYYFSKLLAIILDETVDNLNNILKHCLDSDSRYIKEIVKVCPDNIQKLCRVLRNNLHYERQESVLIGDELECFNELFNVSVTLLEKIRLLLNIKPSKAKLRYYRFVKWLRE